ncbi:hypothetical protein BJ508DRAFT_324833 [Ascobolus immersus RN42]|uniref:Uncharacterized protein n=1 Tax=Ascobolus immersus RN42 TaxID=1160509 RepID=A0A3N4IB03_ASCIM|nr:hypothetical protein BJ508DRAFT_324833 [Ascobolus immersus RN42]
MKRSFQFQDHYYPPMAVSFQPTTLATPVGPSSWRWMMETLHPEPSLRANPPPFTTPSLKDSETVLLSHLAAYYLLSQTPSETGATDSDIRTWIYDYRNGKLPDTCSRPWWTGSIQEIRIPLHYYWWWNCQLDAARVKYQVDAIPGPIETLYPNFERDAGFYQFLNDPENQSLKQYLPVNPASRAYCGDLGYDVRQVFWIKMLRDCIGIRETKKLLRGLQREYWVVGDAWKAAG